MRAGGWLFLAVLAGCATFSDEGDADDDLGVLESETSTPSCNQVAPGWTSSAPSFDHSFAAPYGATLCPKKVRIAWNNARQRYISVQHEPAFYWEADRQICENTWQDLEVWRDIGGAWTQVAETSVRGHFTEAICGDPSGDGCPPASCSFAPATSGALPHCHRSDPNRCGIAYRVYAGTRNTILPSETEPIRVWTSTSVP
jgi:hypothetical protein